MNWPSAYICPLALEPLSQPPPPPTPLGCQEDQLWVPYVVQQAPTGFLVHMW